MDARFWGMVDASGDCWLWTGYPGHAGYGMVRRKGTIATAVRYAYQDIVGAIPDGYEPDHLCRVPNCVNLDHVEIVTKKENILRGYSPSAIAARRTHCKNGHPYDAENTATMKRGGRGMQNLQPSKLPS